MKLRIALFNLLYVKEDRHSEKNSMYWTIL